MSRGDTLFFQAQVFQDPSTLKLVSAPVNQGPSGFVPASIAGFHLWFTAKNTVVDVDQAAIVQLDNAALGGVVLVDASSGKYSVTGPPSATANFADSNVVLAYDVQLKDGSGRIFTVEQGTLTVSPDVTRATS